MAPIPSIEARATVRRGFFITTSPVRPSATENACVQLKFRATNCPRVEAKKELVLAYILGGIGAFRGLPNPVFKRHLRNLRMLVSLNPTAPASEWNAAAKKCWPRELEDLKTYGARMRTNVMCD